MIINLQKKDVEKMLELMNKFPQESNYLVEYDCSPGLGYTIDMIVNVSIKGQQGQFKVPVTDVDSW